MSVPFQCSPSLIYGNSSSSAKRFFKFQHIANWWNEANDARYSVAWEFDTFLFSYALFLSSLYFFDVHLINQFTPQKKNSDTVFWYQMMKFCWVFSDFPSINRKSIKFFACRIIWFDLISVLFPLSFFNLISRLLLFSYCLALLIICLFYFIAASWHCIGCLLRWENQINQIHQICWNL